MLSKYWVVDCFHGIGNLGDALMLKGSSICSENYTITGFSFRTDWNKNTRMLRTHGLC